MFNEKKLVCGAVSTVCAFVVSEFLTQRLYFVLLICLKLAWSSELISCYRKIKITNNFFAAKFISFDKAEGMLNVVLFF